MEEKKACYVIIPEKPMRDSALSYNAIEPAVTSLKDENNNAVYEYLLADELDPSSLKNTQIIDHILHDFIVIADLTDATPLIMYLVGVRHARAKQLILIRSEMDKTDLKSIGDMRIIKYNDPGEPKNSKLLKKEIINALRKIEKKPNKVENPVSQTVQMEILDEQQKKFLEILKEQQDKLTDKINQLSTLSRHIEDYTRKPLTGISQILWESYQMLCEATEGGRIWYVGMTLGLGPPHLYRHTEKGDIDDQIRNYAPQMKINAIEEEMRKKDHKSTLFNWIIEDISVQMARVLGGAKEAKVVCLEQTKTMLKEKFVIPLSKRKSYVELIDHADDVVDNIISRHNKVAGLADKKNPVKYLDSIPIQFMILEKEGRRACLVFHVGTENIAAARLENGELGFYTEIDQMISMFVGTAESLYENAIIVDQ